MSSVAAILDEKAIEREQALAAKKEKEDGHHTQLANDINAAFEAQETARDDSNGAASDLAREINAAFDGKQKLKKELLLGSSGQVGAYAVSPSPSPRADNDNNNNVDGELALKHTLRDVTVVNSSNTEVTEVADINQRNSSSSNANNSSALPRQITGNSIEPVPVPTLRNDNANLQPGAFAREGIDAYRRRSEGTIMILSDPEEARQQQDNSGLIEARRISETPRIDLENAQPVGDENTEEREQIHKRRNVMKLGGLLVCFALFIAVVGTAAALSGKTDDNAVQAPTTTPSPSPTTTPTMAPTPFLLEGLPEYTQNVILSFGEVNANNSPQARAYQWIRDDPELNNLTNWRRLQRFALATFYYATTGDDWKTVGSPGQIFNVTATNIGPARPPPENGPPPRPSQGIGPASEYTLAKAERWLDHDTNECDWYSDAVLRGVPRCNETGFYRSITLHGNNLVGTLPPEIGLLYPTLYGLNLRKNPYLTGSIPSQISQLIYLSMLDLGENQFTGSLPTELGLLTTTHNFRFDNNYLTGSMPTEYLNCWNLRELVLGNNHLTGTIPEKIGEKLNGLILYDVHNNPKMSGTLPRSLGQLKIKIRLRLDGNPFTGSLPTELGNLLNMKEFRVNNTQITSTLPSELGQLQRIGALDLSNNPGIYGTIPEEWGQLPKSLQYLDLRNTEISGALPEEWKFLNETLGYLNLEGTSISGVIPSELCSVKELRFSCNATRLCGCDCPCQ